MRRAPELRSIRRRSICASACAMLAAAATAQTIIVDNSDPGFSVLSQTWSTGTSAPGHWGPDYRYRQTTASGAAFGEVEWRPNLPAAGAYQVAIYYPQGGNRANDAPFTVYHADGADVFPVDQQQNGGQWNVLGTFEFNAGNDGCVRLSNDANPTVVIADAVSFTSVGPEFRGFWADAFHSGFKSTGEIDTMIGWALAGNYNAIIPEVLAFHDTGGGGHGAYWNSGIVPKASDIAGGIDPLAYLVQQAHASGLEVHAWLVAFRVSATWPPAGNPLVAAHPEWLMVRQADMNQGPLPVVDGDPNTTDYYTLDPGAPDAQEYLMSIVRELCADYEIDGVHWDYIRYTQTDAGYPTNLNYPRSTLRRFQNITGYVGVPPPTGVASWNDFRRRTISDVVRRAMFEVPTTPNPRQPLRHTAALVTWYPANSDFHQTNAYNLFCDWEYWQYMGYLDATVPMCYFDEGTYGSTYRAWVDNSVTWANSAGRQTYIGPGIYLNTFASSVTQLLYARSAGAHGFSTYSYRSTNDAGATWSDWYPYVAATVFTEPIAPPVMPWRDPATATEGTVFGRVTDGATGIPIDNATIKLDGTAVVQADGNGYYIVTHLSAGSAGTPVPLSAAYAGYADVLRPAVLVERAGFTEANFALGTWLPGDYDVDGDVDLDDFAYFAPSLTGPDQGPPPAGSDLFDFDQDNDVDLPDFAVFQQSFGQ